MSSGKRRAPSIEERLTPCHCCAYRLTQRHHMLPFAQHGETPLTHALCASCHDTLHLMLSAHYKPTEHNIKVWEGVQSDMGHQNERLIKLLALAWDHIDLIDDHKFTNMDVDFGDGFEVGNPEEYSGGEFELCDEVSES